MCRAAVERQDDGCGRTHAKDRIVSRRQNKEKVAYYARNGMGRNHNIPDWKVLRAKEREREYSSRYLMRQHYGMHTNSEGTGMNAS